MVMDSSKVIPLTEIAECNLSTSEAYEYLTKAGMFTSNQRAYTPTLLYSPEVARYSYMIQLKWEANKKKIR